VRLLDLRGERCLRVVDGLRHAVTTHPLVVGCAHVRDHSRSRIDGELRRERAHAACGADDQDGLPAQGLERFDDREAGHARRRHGCRDGWIQPGRDARQP
jgi:hypothetical protein